MKTLTVGSLFAGIGGFDLGFERAGFEIKWQVEIDPYCREVLETHWPGVRRFKDVKECCGSPLRRSHDDQRCAECGRSDWLSRCDVLTGGFPCQDISPAGRRAGIRGKQSGLWSEFHRLIRELRPRYVVVENSSNLLADGYGMDIVIGELAAVGYDAEWDCLPAAAFGAPHERERVWIVAYPARRSQRRTSGHERVERSHDYDRQPQDGRNGAAIADPDSARSPIIFGRSALTELARFRAAHGDPWWGIEPKVVRVVHGVSATVVRRKERHPDQIGGLGNAIVPQIAEWIAHRIKDAEGLT